MSEAEDPQPRQLAQNTLEERPAKRMGGGMFILTWIILLAMLIYYFTGEERRQFNPNETPTLIDVQGKRTLLLKANRQNHFVMSGKINGKDTTLVLDTGATNVAIPAIMASRLQLAQGKPGIAMTANGPVTVYSTRIAKLQLGEIVLYDVPADLNPGMNASNQILLGMSALSQVEFSQRDGMLLISQWPKHSTSMRIEPMNYAPINR